MPFNTVQYPNTSPEDTGSEITVHWCKDSHVQLEVVRHVWSPPAPGETGTVREWDGKKAKEVASTPDPNTTPPVSGLPIGTVRIYQGELAFKIGNRRQETEFTGTTVGLWQIMDLEPVSRASFTAIPANNVVMDEDVNNWPIIWRPDNGLVESRIYTDPLNRGQINEMIRTLRRARNAAYGEDA